MSFISWIILGLIAGFIGSKVTGRGLATNIAIGIGGALVGGFLFDLFGASGVTGLNLYSMIVATVGSVVVLLIYDAVAPRRQEAREPTPGVGSDQTMSGTAAPRRREAQEITPAVGTDQTVPGAVPKGSPILVKTTAPVRIFISYRREDGAQAGRISDRLRRDLGDNQIFMDVDAIRLGTNFVEALNKEVAKCDWLLALIGPNWLDLRDKDGRRLLDNTRDFVRIEIAAALQRQIPVVPILLEGREVPNADQLPPDLQELRLRQGLELRNSSFHADMDRLVRELKSPAPAA